MDKSEIAIYCSTFHSHHCSIALKQMQFLRLLVESSIRAVDRNGAHLVKSIALLFYCSIAPKQTQFLRLLFGRGEPI